MPSNTHLQWQEIRDMTGGLWTIGDWLMPPNAAQQMTDCYPNASGGLRAFFKPTTIVTTGVVNIAQEGVIGIFSRGAGASSGVGTLPDRYLTTFNSTDWKIRLYRMNVATGGTTWTLLKTFAAAAPNTWPNPTTWATYHLTGGTVTHVIMSVYGLSADDGIWAINYADGVMTKLTTSLSVGLVGPVAVHQSRIVAANVDGNIQFTGPGDEVFGQNLITKEPSRDGSQVTWLMPYSPGDLLVATAGGPFFLIEDDVTNYTLRTMSDSRTVQSTQTPAYGPMGPIYLCAFEGIFETMDGSLHNGMTQPLSSKEFASVTLSKDNNGDVSFGQVNFLKHWVIAPHGLVMDYNTKAWFKTSFLAAPADSYHSVVSRLNEHVIAATQGANFTIYDYNMNEAASSPSRAESYTWQSAPLRDPTGRQVEIREVQIYARSFNGATSTVAVTVNGVTQTLACDVTQDNLAFLFRQRSDTLDVTVTAASNASGVEAPAIETVRIGSHPQHQMY